MDSIHLPNTIALPNAFGAPGAPLSPGQVVQALVLALIESDVFRLQLPQAVVDVRSDVPLKPGSMVTLAVQSGGANTRLVIYSDAPPSAPRAQGVAPSLAGRQPIGEAIVIARAPASAIAPEQGRAATESAVVRAAPSITPAVASPAAAPARAVTPEQAVSEAVRFAASRQSGLGPLFADLEQSVHLLHALPAPVRAAADQILRLRIPLGPQLSAVDVKQAFMRSGVLLEPGLGREKSITPERSQANTPPQPPNDLKAALLVFREVLRSWAAAEPVQSRALGSAAAEAPSQGSRLSTTAAAISRVANALAGAPEELATAPFSAEQATTLARTVATALAPRDGPAQPLSTPGALPPPYRGAPLAAQAAAAPSIAPDAAPHEVAEKLMVETDGALARTTLLQAASLPEQNNAPRAEAAQRWNFEIPFATPQGTSIAQFEVSRDARAPQSDAHTRTWRARFSLDVEPMGAVHVQIALAGARTSVTLWAERADTATRLNESAPMLSDALRAAELEPGDLQLRVGVPPTMRQAAPGRFMDRAT